MMRVFTTVLIAIISSSCSFVGPAAPIVIYDETGTRNKTLSLNGLSQCNTNPQEQVTLNASKPVYLMVHGCNGSAGSFLKLADVLQYQGKQTLCYSYDDREKLSDVARQLAQTVTELSNQISHQQITIIGHSQGGLITRKATTKAFLKNTDINLKLVTVSAPLSGIEAAAPCGNTKIRVATLGLHDLACRLISGAKWFEITSSSEYIQKPGELQNSVSQYVQIITDERDSCRTIDTKGVCLKDDFVFNLHEQQLPTTPAGLQGSTQIIKDGHVSIVGENGKAPYKLISALQKEGVLDEFKPNEQAEFNQFIKTLYLAER